MRFTHTPGWLAGSNRPRCLLPSHDYSYEVGTAHTTTGFVYDALGRRYSRTAGGATTVFVSAGSQVLLEKSSDPYGQGDTFTAAYTHGNALLRRNSEYPLYDGHGSERTVTNGSETVTDRPGHESPACAHETHDRGFMAIPRRRDSSLQPDDSSSGACAGAWRYRTDGHAWLMRVCRTMGIRSPQ